jgi:carbamoyl-phosphate synthase small subunit
VIASLVLEDGTFFAGESVGAEGFAFGEAVFTTSMSGYQEVATDPSFEGQIVCFTAPMVGNYGIDQARSESRRPHAKAIVMREARGPQWTDWLHEHGIVGLTGIDTRSLVLHLREAGAMRAAAVTGEADVEEVVSAVHAQPEMAGAALVAGVSTKERYTYASEGAVRVAVVDYGCKRSILRRRSSARRRHSATCSAARRCWESVSATNCSRSPPAAGRSSCRSAIAAPTTRCSTTAPAACSSPLRTTASRSRRATMQA